MITIIFDCDKCGQNIKKYNALRDMKEIVEDFGNSGTEYTLCPECTIAYFAYRKELKEKYNLEIDKELKIFVYKGRSQIGGY